MEVSAAGDSRRRGHDGIRLQTPGDRFQPTQETTRSLVRLTHDSCNLYLLRGWIQDFPQAPNYYLAYFCLKLHIIFFKKWAETVRGGGAEGVASATVLPERIVLRNITITPCDGESRAFHKMSQNDRTVDQ